MSGIINFDNVDKSYGSFQALNNLSFSINSHETVALVGNNGSGKTTTVNVLCNLITYDKGAVYIFDKKLSPNYVSYKNKIGVLLSPPILVKEFTPEQYLNFVCRFQNVEKTEVQGRIDDLINSFEISGSKSKRISELSAGNKMKIAFAASIIHNPQILILDEPFVHIDIKTIDFIMNLLISFKGKKTLLITSHNIDLIFDFCERILLMENGHIIEDFILTKDQPVEMIKEMIKEKVIKQKINPTKLDWLK